MAKRSRSRHGMKKMEKCQRTLYYTTSTTGTKYFDTAKDLSIVNRKLFRQGRCYGIESIEISYTGNPSNVDYFTVRAGVAGDTWVIHNAWTKGNALWNEMNQLVLEDNPSIAGKWADYKVYLDTLHSTVGVNMVPRDFNKTMYLQGEWVYSTYTMPQHDVDPATGLPDPADVSRCHLIGPHLQTASGAFTSAGLVEAYSQSRATVFDNNPNVPPGMSTSFFNLLTDSGSQEPELSLQIEYENDDPPYDLLEYPGSEGNARYPVMAEFGATSIGAPNVVLSPFVAQCGLIALEFEAYKDGITVPISDQALEIKLTVMPGSYKGVAAIPMGQ